jgi:small-conductance mechanosensitive channel
MKSQPGTGAESTMLTEQDNERVRQRREELQKQAEDFEAQLAALEQEYTRSSALFKLLGRAFGFGAAGKLERARFKVSYKRQQLAEFEPLHLDERPER